jgi:hypothetical protein
MPYKFKIGDAVAVKDVPSVRRGPRRAYIGKPATIRGRKYQPAMIHFGTWYLLGNTCWLFRARELEAAPVKKTRKKRGK